MENDSIYWLTELKRTETELAELVNGDSSLIKTAKTDEDNITTHDIDKLIQTKLTYIGYCKNRYDEELSKENNSTAVKSKLFIGREYGY
ncbi:MAG: hypothetical protein ACRC0Y_04040 [Fusobacteriaceae bacterium]